MSLGRLTDGDRVFLNMADVINLLNEIISTLRFVSLDELYLESMRQVKAMGRVMNPTINESNWKSRIENMCRYKCLQAKLKDKLVIYEKVGQECFENFPARENPAIEYVSLEGLYHNLSAFDYEEFMQNFPADEIFGGWKWPGMAGSEDHRTVKETLEEIREKCEDLSIFKRDLTKIAMLVWGASLKQYLPHVLFIVRQMYQMKGVVEFSKVDSALAEAVPKEWRHKYVYKDKKEVIWSKFGITKSVLFEEGILVQDKGSKYPQINCRPACLLLALDFLVLHNEYLSILSNCLSSVDANRMALSEVSKLYQKVSGKVWGSNEEEELERSAEMVIVDQNKEFIRLRPNLLFVPMFFP